MIAPINERPRLPKGFRAMTHDEARALVFDAPLQLFDREANQAMRARVCNVPSHGEWIEVRTIHAAAVIRLELVDADGAPCYAEDDESNVAAMVDCEAEEGAYARLAQRIDQIANHAQGLPNRDDVDALVAENAHLRDLIRSLALRVERLETRRAAA